MILRMTKSETLRQAALEVGVTSMRSRSPAEKRRLERKSEALRLLSLRAAARTLKERYSSHPFYAARAQNNKRYWIDLATGAVNV